MTTSKILKSAATQVAKLERANARLEKKVERLLERIERMKERKGVRRRPVETQDETPVRSTRKVRKTRTRAAVATPVRRTRKVAVSDQEKRVRRTRKSRTAKKGFTL